MKISIPANRKIINATKKSVLASPLRKRVICLIAHGTSLFAIRELKKSDLDFELILSNPEPQDYKNLRRIVNQSPCKIEIQLRYYNEISKLTSLIMCSNYKLFMYFAYANGNCLLGKNIYKKLVGLIHKNSVRQSILISTQISFKDIRKSYFAGAFPYIVNKNIMRTLVGICMYEKLLDYRDLGNRSFLRAEKEAFVPLITEHYSKKLTSEDKAILNDFIGAYKSNKSNTEVFSIIEKIINLFEIDIRKNAT